jgi:hypothetical protein
MIIKFSPQVSVKKLILEKIENTLVLNGDAVDLSEFPVDSVIDHEDIENDYLLSVESDLSGEITVIVLWPYSDINSEREAYPNDLINPNDGVLTP